MPPVDQEALDAELSAALDEIEGTQAEDEGDEAPPVDDKPVGDKPVEEPVGDKDEEGEDDKPAKDDKGKKPDVSEAAKTLAAAKKGAKKGDEPPVVETDEKLLLPPGPDGKPREVDTKAAPSSWRKEAAAKFSTLPKEIREEIHKREDDMHRGLSNYKSAADYAAAVAGEFEPYRAYLRSNNMNEIGVIRELMGTAYALRSGTPEQRAQLILDIGATYGVDWSLAAQIAAKKPPAAGGAQPVADPRVNDLLAREQAREQEQMQRINASAATEWNAFQADPKNEFVAIVKEDMARLIETGQANDLRDAYDKAIWLNPAVRAKLTARQAETERAQAAERAAAAKKASRGNVARRATPTAGAAPKSTLDETLSSAYDKLFAG